MGLDKVGIHHILLTLTPSHPYTLTLSDHTALISTHIYYCKCDQVLIVQRLDQMGPFHILLAEMGLDKVGIEC